MLKKVKWLFLSNLFINSIIFSIELAYPVMSCENLIYFIHQKSLEKIEFCSCDIKGNRVNTDLVPNCLPGDLTLLPNKTGFSFIDQGKIRIKYFNLERINTINLTEPIYNISTINWLDNETCYFSAKKGTQFNIFFVNIKDSKLFYIGELSTKMELGSDFLYPQVVNSSLFFIERAVDKRYKTKKAHYKIIKVKCPNYLNSGSKFLATLDKEILIDFKSRAINFLQMTSENDGFFIEHESLIDKTDKTMSFIFHQLHLDKIENIFKNKELFSFSIPIKYFFGNTNERLYESILPFLPKLYEDKIYYSHCSDEEKLIIDLYSYNLKSGKIEKETFAVNDEIYFSPILVKDKIFYGCNFTNSDFTACNFLKSFIIKQ